MNPPEPSPLAITLCPRPGGGTLVRLVGDLDIAVVDQVEQALIDARASGPVLVDLSCLDFMDCTGINLFLRARRRDPSLRLTPPSPAIRRLFRLGRIIPAYGLWEDSA